MFSLNAQRIRIENVNLRSGIHGDDSKLAVDIKFSFQRGNDILDLFDAGLKPAFYREAEDGDSLDGDLLTPVLPKLRFGLLAGAIKWGYEGSGYTIIVHWGVSGQRDIVMGGATVDKFSFEFSDGGSVTTTFRAIVHPLADDLGRLAELIQQETAVTIEPPSIEDQLKRDLVAQGKEE